jgi:hypothetical protein
MSKKKDEEIRLLEEQLLSLRSDLALEKAEVEKLRADVARLQVGERRPLPTTRLSLNRKFKLPACQETFTCPSCSHVWQEPGGPDRMYAVLGFYPDGRPGELFIRSDRPNGFQTGILDVFAIVVSLALQFGCPMEVIAKKLIGQRFEPHGLTSDKEFPMVSSPVDYLGRWLMNNLTLKEHPFKE